MKIVDQKYEIIPNIFRGVLCTNHPSVMMATFLNMTGFFIYWFTKFENLTTVCDIEISSNSDLEVHTKSELVEISLSYPVYPDLFLSNLPSDEI